MFRFLFKWLFRILAFFFASTILVAFAYKFLPVYVTPLMCIRAVQQVKADEDIVWHHTWTPIEEITPNLPRAVIASEDNLFMKHHGLDFEAIKKARKENLTRKRPRGASTISQQTAKNVFLWPKSSMFRKGLEVYFTYLIEFLWGKERIMEIYLNSIEMGKGIYGAEAVAKYHFNTTASKLSWNQCALIAASLPNPIKFNSAKPSAYMYKRQGQISSLMNKIGPVDLKATAKDDKASKQGAKKK